MTATIIDAANAPDVRRTLARLHSQETGASWIAEPALIRDGQRLFALVEVTRSTWPIDEEMARLGTSPYFLDLIDHARRQPDEIPADEVAHLLRITDDERATARARRRRR